MSRRAAQPADNVVALPDAAAKADTDDKSKLGHLKLSWLEALMSAYPEIDHATIRVALCIATAITQRRRRAYISKQTIADKTGVSLTRVKVALRKLRDEGWLIWKRTGDANIYELLLLPENVNDIDDRQIILRDRRNEARKTKRKRFREGPPTAHLNHPR
jgi:biotin operon repressor